MAKILVIGAGSVANVFLVMAAKFAKENPELADVFSQLVLASRRLESCKAIRENVLKRIGIQIEIHQLDANNVEATIALIKEVKPDIVLNLATPTTDLAIMTACVKTGVRYADTANHQPSDETEFRYEWQWGLHEMFRLDGNQAVLGIGFDPGAVGVYTAYALKHEFDEIHYLDTLDCNAGDHGYPFAFNFDTWTNATEVTQRGRYWDHGRWIEIDPIIGKRPGRQNHWIMFDYPGIGPRKSYIIFHEDLQSVVKHFRKNGLKRARFWMTFGDDYLTCLWVLQNVGMIDINRKIEIAPSVEITPLDFLAKVLPDPGSLGSRYTGETCIGVRIFGMKDGLPKTIFIYNRSSHPHAFKLTGGQGISWTTAIPALAIITAILKGQWSRAGVFNVEEFDPDPVMAYMKEWIPWQIIRGDDVPPLDYESDKIAA